MTIPMLPTIGEEVGPNLRNFFQGMMQIANPHFDLQQELKKRAAIDPNLRQEIIDQEWLNPGYISRTFGKQVAYLAQGQPSSKAQMEAFDRTIKPTTPLSQVEAMGSVGSENYLKKNLGYTSTELSQQASAATIAKERARAAPAMSDADIAKAQAELDIAKNQAALSKKSMSDRLLVEGVEKRYGANTHQLIEDAANARPYADNTQAPNTVKKPANWQGEFNAVGLRPEELSALQEDKGYENAIKERNTTWREAAWAKSLAAKDQRVFDQSHAEFIRQSSMIDAKKYGVSSQDLFTIRSNPQLSSQLDALARDPQKATSVIQQNPQIGRLLNTWSRLNEGYARDADVAKDAVMKDYQKMVNGFTAERDKDKAKGIAPNEALIQSQLMSLNLERQKLQRMGISMPELRYGKEGTWKPFSSDIYAVDPSGAKITDPTQYAEPMAMRGTDIDTAAKDAAEGGPAKFKQLLDALGSDAEMKNKFTQRYLYYKKLKDQSGRKP